MTALRSARCFIASLGSTALLALTACGGGGDPAALPGSGDAGGGAPVGGTPTLLTAVDYTATARPLAVTPTLDTGAGAVHEADVPLSGATLAVTGGNGTRYTLVVPANALRSPTRIRMQAVSALAGVPAGVAAVHGVQLEPGGLHFINPATLTIEPSAPVPLPQQAFYGYGLSGSDMHPIPGELGAVAKVAVWHFSGYGMATLEREGNVSRVFIDVVPAGLEARLGAAMAAAFMQARDGTIGDAQLAAIVESLLRQYEAEVLGPQHAAAGRSCANAITAFTAELAFNRQRQLLGLGGTDATAALATMATLRSVCFEEANQRCRVSGNIQQLIADHLGVERQSQLLGVDDAAATAREEAAIDKCGRYEFQFDSTLTFDGNTVPSPLGYARLSVATRVPVKLTTAMDGLEGEARIAHTETFSRFNCAAVGCGYYLIQGTRPDTALVRKAVPEFLPMQGIDVWARGQPVAQTGTFRVEFDPQSPGEDVDAMLNAGPILGIVNANRVGGLPPFQETFWAGFYSLVNMSETRPAGGFYWAADWTQPAYPVMFERATAPSLDNALAHFVAITRAKLVHKPI